VSTEPIVVQPGNDCELLLLKEFQEKSRIKNRVISQEDKEYPEFGMLMQETDYNDAIDTLAHGRQAKE
jgi:hypothetical protein